MQLEFRCPEMSAPDRRKLRCEVRFFRIQVILKRGSLRTSEGNGCLELVAGGAPGGVTGTVGIRTVRRARAVEERSLVAAEPIIGYRILGFKKLRSCTGKRKIANPPNKNIGQKGKLARKYQ